MNKICLFFQIHRPFILKTFRYFEVGKSKPYWEDSLLERDTQDFANNVILPNNEMLEQLVRQTKGAFRFSFYISGPALDLLLTYAPEAIDSLRTLADSGAVEFAGGTSSHSIVSLAQQEDEFKKQIRKYRERMEYFFDQSPHIFVNSDLLYNDQIAKSVTGAGYQAVLTNGTPKVLRGKSPNYLYRSTARKQLKIFFRNEPVSNLISDFLTGTISSGSTIYEKFKMLAELIPEKEPITVVYFNYPDFSRIKSKEQQKPFAEMVKWLVKSERFSFGFPSEVAERFGEIEQISVADPVCWHDQFHPDYFPGNDLQKDAIDQLFKLTRPVDASFDFDLKTDWQYLQATDHFHLMDDNYQVYKMKTQTNSSFNSKYDAYINYMNVLDDLSYRLKSEKDPNRRTTGMTENASRAPKATKQKK